MQLQTITENVCVMFFFTYCSNRGRQTLAHVRIKKIVYLDAIRRRVLSVMHLRKHDGRVAEWPTNDKREIHRAIFQKTNGLADALVCTTTIAAFYTRTNGTAHVLNNAQSRRYQRNFGKDGRPIFTNVVSRDTPANFIIT